jgi:hypothetical protein
MTPDRINAKSFIEFLERECEVKFIDAATGKNYWDRREENNGKEARE